MAAAQGAVVPCDVDGVAAEGGRGEFQVAHVPAGSQEQQPVRDRCGGISDLHTWPEGLAAIGGPEDRLRPSRGRPLQLRVGDVDRSAATYRVPVAWLTIGVAPMNWWNEHPLMGRVNLSA